MDGTRQNCVVKVNGVNIRAGWKLLAIAWEMSLGKEDDTSPPWHFKFRIPSLPLTGTSADNTWAAVTSHPLTRPWYTFLLEVIGLVRHSPILAPCDDKAAANEKRQAHELLTFPTKTYYMAGICMNHSNSNGSQSISVAMCSGLQLTYDLHVGLTFLNCGTHLLRCAAAVGNWYDKTLQVVKAPRQ